MKGFSFRRVKAVVKKEFRQIRRDPLSLGFLIFLPALLLVLYGFVLDFDVKHLTLGVLDQDRSPESRALVDAFSVTGYFDLKHAMDKPSDIDRLMGRDEMTVALVIPVDFSEDLAAGRKPRLQVVIDGTNSSSASTAMGHAASIIREYSMQVNMKAFARRGGRTMHLPVSSETRVWYNPELRSPKFLIPGLMGFILMVVLVTSTSFAVVKEKERGTMEQILVSPLRPQDLVFAKVIPYVLILLAAAHLILLAGYLLFGVGIRGSYPLLLALVLLFLLCGLGQGILISTLVRTQQVAFMLAVLSTLLPTFILSGFVFPIREMPGIVQALTYVVPARYFLKALRGIILKGTGFSILWPQFVFLAVFSAANTWISILKMRKDEPDRAAGKKRRAG